MFYHVSELPSFLILNNIPLDGQTTFCLSIRLRTDTGQLPCLVTANRAVLNVGLKIHASPCFQFSGV